MTDVSPFCLSIEPTEGKTFQYGFHLGTDERLARVIAVEKFQQRNAAGAERPELFTRTVALMRNRRIVDVYDGRWSSEYGFED